MRTLRVLVVDNQGLVRSKLGKYIAALGHTPLDAANGSSAMYKIFENSLTEPVIDALITEPQLHVSDGVWLLQTLHLKKCRVPCLLHSTQTQWWDEKGTLDLRDITQHFPFAQFHKKELHDLSYVQAFLASI